MTHQPDPELVERPLEALVGELLCARHLTLATAESCTGGLLSHRLTNIPGSSAYVVGGVVAYSSAVKQQMLGVRPQTLGEHGPISDPVTRQMAAGVRIMLGSDIGLSVTGLAGPGGATDTMPVGLVFVGLSAIDGLWLRRFEFQGDRLGNKTAAASAALRLLLDYLEGTV